MLYPLYQTQGAASGGSTPHTFQLTRPSRVVSPPEFTPPASRTPRVRKPSSSNPRQKKISSRTPKRQKKHMGFTELMNAPDVNEVQQREEAPSKLPNAHPSKAPLQPPSGHPTDPQPHPIAEDKDEPPAEPRNASKRLDFYDPPQS
ncbi:hypothetical protein SUGI_0023660 [Cryptomeria japonica]|nr:hypothetical protein SUGI_0023660 [Cryptomeria japonica]